MSETVLVNYRLDKDRPLRLRWLAEDGVPGDGYKAQVTAIVFGDGDQLAMDGSAILEQTAPDPAGGAGAYVLTFNGMVGYAADHPDRARVEAIGDDEVEYRLSFVHDDGHDAVEDRDYKIIERPRAHARKLGRK